MDVGAGTVSATEFASSAARAPTLAAAAGGQNDVLVSGLERGGGIVVVNSGTREEHDMSEAQAPTVVFDGGPRDGELDTIDALPAVIGTGAEGGVYQRTEDGRDGLTVYAWQPLADSERDAIVRGDLRGGEQAR
jgi:hypothetical protein